jgi:hypothetical protein
VVEHSVRVRRCHARNGAVGIGTVDAEGDLHFNPLPRIRTQRHADKVHYRWYNELRFPEHLGGGTITVRLHGDAEDQARRFNRTENVRPIPPDDPTFPTLFRRRNDAESINRALEDTMWLRRAHSLGHRRQLLNLLGYALMVNSLAIARHTRAPAQAAA